jgi:hypothetical protein
LSEGDESATGNQYIPAEEQNRFVAMSIARGDLRLYEHIYNEVEFVEAIRMNLLRVAVDYRDKGTAE